jgi:multidrug efflux pump subunit AcrB
MFSLWNFFLAKRQFTWLMITALVGVGLYALVEIPKESTPEVIVPIGIVSTVYPGASAEDVERLVTNKIEDAAGNVENLDTITSASSDGVSVVTVQFNASANVDRSIDSLKDAVDRVKQDLPEEANDPNVMKVNFADQPVLVISVSADLPPTEFTRLSEQLSDQLESVSGVQRVEVTGVRAREVQVVVRPEALEAYHLSLQQVITAIGSANVSLPAGTITTGGIEYPIEFKGNLDNPDAVRALPVTSANGRVVYLSDIATVSSGVERASSYARVSQDGAPAEPAMTLYVYKNAGADVTTIAGNVRDEITSMQQQGGLLDGSQVLVSLDLGEEIYKDLSELVRAGLETVVLVILSLLLTIGWRESLVAALSIPLSFVIAFIGLWASGNTINFVSLFALILAVGILVDSGIVVTEAIHTRMRRYGDADEAARAALHEYAWPLIGGTMTTVAVFVPLFFISGIVGEFIKSIPFTIIFVLIASIFVALGMVPLIAIRLTKNASTNRLEVLQEAYTHRIQEWYRGKLLAFFANRRAQRIFIWALWLGLAVSIALPFTGLVSTIFFPPEDSDYVYVEFEKPQSTPLDESDLTLRAMEEILYEKPYVESFTSTAGAGSAFASQAPGSGGRFGNITVKLAADRDLTSAAAAEDLRATFADVKNADVRVTEQAGGPPSGAPVVIKFTGDDLDDLARATDNAETLLSSIPGVINITATTKNITTEFAFTIDRAKASALGVTPAQVASTLRTAVYGTTATTIKRQGEDIDVVVKLALNPNFTDPAVTTNVSLDALKHIAIETQHGSVLVGSVLSDSLDTANASIAHEDKERVHSISAYVAPGTTASDVVNTFKTREAELNLPSSVHISYGGETEDINQSFTEMFFALIAGLVLMLAILVLAFNSVRYALYLLMVVPLSLIGVLDGLALTGQPISFTSLLGVVALAGVIINHAIILMDSMLHFRARDAHRPLADVVADAAVSRLRPIVLTTIATVVGMIPLSRVSDFWSPLAYAIMFGLTFAMLLTLVLVPTMFFRREQRVLERAMKAR